jgi:hypothetical protein
MRNERKTGNWVIRLLIALAAIPMVAWCQTPVVSKVVDAASYALTLGSPGSIATIFGTNLARRGYGNRARGSAAAPAWRDESDMERSCRSAVLCFAHADQFPGAIPRRYNPGVLVTAGVVVSTAAGNSVPYKPGSGTSDASGYAAGLFHGRQRLRPGRGSQCCRRWQRLTQLRRE